MRAKSIIHLGLMSAGLLFNNLTFATLPDNAPKELKYFVESDFDSIHLEALKTHAVPVKILLPSLILEGRERGWIAKDSFDYKAVFKKAGLNYPEKVIFGGVDYKWRNEILPMGIVQKSLDFGVNANIKIANLSCVACHSGSQYDSQGIKVKNVQVIGSPSDSFNPEIYVSMIYKGMKRVNNDWDAATSIMNKLFPDSSIREKLIFKTIIRSQVKSYMKEHAVIDNATPFLNGGPGLTNGVASLKNVLGLDTAEGSNTGFTSIPSLGDRGFRTSLLYDGVYSNANKDAFRVVKHVNAERLNDVTTVAALFTVPTMGQTTKRAQKNVELVVKMVSPVLSAYKTADYPGAIDQDRAKKGLAVYNNSCLQCHGEYTWNGGNKSKLISFPNVLVPQDEMNSDNNRWLSVTDSIAKNMAESKWKNLVQVNQNQGYVATVLEGLWASAPYMHNGSVPTLWHFMRPELRPAKFIVGDQSLDMQKVGIAGLVNSTSEIYDTTLSGRANTGHEKEFETMSEDDKDDLLEFLKTL